MSQIIPEDVLHALGWTVLHSLWQAFIVALLLAFFLLAFPKKAARYRYYMGFAALGTTFILSVITFMLLRGSGGLVSPEVTRELFSDGGSVTGEVYYESRPSSLLAGIHPYLSVIVTAWFTGMVFFMLKMLGGLLYIQRLKHRSLVEVPEQWTRILKELQVRMSLSKEVKMAGSALVKVPMVVGMIKPVILMPVGAINQLSVEEVEAVIAHELAHIARFDYLFNLLQSFIEVLFYFNPAIWWISSRIRIERENCCDDVAVQLCGSSLVYARALVSLQELHVTAPAFAMSFFKNKHQLFTRLQRILQSPDKKSNAMEKISVTVLLLAALIVLSVQAHSNVEKTPVMTKNELAGSPYEPVILDTIPEEEMIIHRKNDEEEVEVHFKNDKITYLKIDGEEIPESDYGKYDDVIQGMRENMPPYTRIHPVWKHSAPAPPSPPAPPAPPGAQEVPPTPPAPPAPPAGKRKIITEQHKDGTTIIIETAPGVDPVKIEMNNGHNRRIIINGNEIKGLKEGDRTVIVEEGAPFYFFQNPDGEAFYMPGLETLEDFEIPLIKVDPESYAFVYPDKPGSDRFFSPKFPGSGNQGLFEEYLERQRDGNLSEEWLEEFHEKMRGSGDNSFFPLKKEEIRKRQEEAKARMEELGLRENERMKRLEETEQLRRFEWMEQSKQEREEMMRLQEELMRKQGDEMKRAEELMRKLEREKVILLEKKSKTYGKEGM